MKIVMLGCGPSLDRFWKIRDEREYDRYISINSAIHAVPERYNHKHYHIGNDGIHIDGYHKVGEGEITWFLWGRPHTKKYITKYPKMKYLVLDDFVKREYEGSGVDGWVLALDIFLNARVKKENPVTQIDVYGFDFCEFTGEGYDKPKLDMTLRVNRDKVGYFYASSQGEYVLPFQIPKVHPLDYWQIRKRYLKRTLRIVKTSERAHKKQFDSLATFFAHAPKDFKEAVHCKGFIELLSLFPAAHDCGYRNACNHAMPRLKAEEEAGV